MTTEMPEWIVMIGNFGFPIAITIYLFIRFEKKIEKLEVAITDLRQVIQESRRNERK
ncbi:YvrJ family protein [Priestia koreensis]|uniref:YvrJ family protein n=1 Tax=Priestia koreensis TaxID=284581 RepID=UPI00203BE490|nr:YvrJ family protein [Priestia koreensis]MCM3006829.1 YvrJ family protein [Priestia koreensis]